MRRRRLRSNALPASSSSAAYVFDDGAEIPRQIPQDIPRARAGFAENTSRRVSAWTSMMIGASAHASVSFHIGETPPSVLISS